MAAAAVGIAALLAIGFGVNQIIQPSRDSAKATANIAMPPSSDLPEPAWVDWVPATQVLHNSESSDTLISSGFSSQSDYIISSVTNQNYGRASL